MSRVNLTVVTPRIKRVAQYLPLDDRIALMVRKLACGCWQWYGAKVARGYATIKNGRAAVRVHRHLYESLRGPIAAGLECDHLCRNTSCVNPCHIEPVTHAENVRRGNAGKHLAARSHCKNGHSFTGDNLVARKDGGKRRCRQCARKKALEHYHRNRETIMKRMKEAYRTRKTNQQTVRRIK